MIGQLVRNSASSNMPVMTGNEYIWLDPGEIMLVVGEVRDLIGQSIVLLANGTMARLSNLSSQIEVIR